MARPRWTERDLPDLHGRCALVTGANSGLGLETARALAAHGAHVVLACRGRDKADAAMAQIRGSVADAQLSFLPLDLSDLSSVRECAAAYSAAHARLDILCNNAGIMGPRHGRTRDGFELQFGTNHLGHFALTGRLLDTLRRTPGARVVTLSSVAHRSGRLALDDLHFERRRYSRSAGYGQSKLANLMFALELDRRLKRAGIDAISVAAHPGYSATNIVFGGASGTRSLLGTIWAALAGLGNALLAQPAALGALPTLYAATAPVLAGGEFIGPQGLLQFRGYPVVVRPARHALDEEAAARLWKASGEMTGVACL